MSGHIIPLHHSPLCRKRIEKINWSDRVRNGISRRAKEKRDNLYTIKRRKTNWICRILLMFSLINHVIEGKRED